MSGVDVGAHGRRFVCDVEPRGDGGWDIWISEEPYRGVDTDAALSEWDRKRIGGTWTSRRLVGHRRARVLADWAARKAIRHAGTRAAANDRANEQWRSNHNRPPFRVTTTDETRQP